MTAFDAEALWNKAKLFLERGLKARDEADFGTFHIWAALALELLGKSALATIHPALVADPTKFDSLLVACGHPVNDNTRSIMAKTTYERLKHLSKDFDDRAERFCMLMANRRNEELHSGSSPTTDLEPRAWVPEFWRITEIVSRIASRTLDDLVGTSEAARVQEVIKDTSRVLAAAVEARIERCRADFNRKYPPGSAELVHVLQAVKTAGQPAGHRGLLRDTDHFKRIACPSCGADGWLFGNEGHSERRPVESDGEIAWQVEDVAYYTEAFACTACSLVLNGRVELDAAELSDEFEDERDVEPDYDSDYGND